MDRNEMCFVDTGKYIASILTKMFEKKLPDLPPKTTCLDELWRRFQVKHATAFNANQASGVQGQHESA